MGQKNEVFTAELTNAGIDEISEKIRTFLSSLKLEKRDIIRYTLSAEEILLDCINSQSCYESVSITTGTKFFMPYISLQIRGPALNVCVTDREENGVIGNNLLTSLGISPEYAYKNQTNIYHFRLRKKQTNPFVSLIIVLAFAIITGLLGMLLPQPTRELIITNFFDRIHNTFLNILSSLASPMIFLSVAWGIYGIGDAATLKRIGKRLMLRYMAVVCLCLSVGAAICFPIIKPTFAASESTGSISFIFSMILDIIPKDIISPFLNGNTLQIIFMAVIFGIALLFLGQKTQSVAKAIEQINFVIQFIIEFISKLVPYFIFIVIVSMIWSNAASDFLELKSLFSVFLLVVLATQLLILLFSAAGIHINPLLLFKKGLTSLIIALTTASSAAAFGSNIKACRDEYGIDETVSSFGIPLGMVMFKPCTALAYMVAGVFFAKMYNVEISAFWIFILLFSSAVLSMATPPIPGGALTAYTVLFAQLGIPAGAVAIALTCDVLFDFISTGFDQFSLPLCLLSQASRLGLVNRSVLESDSKKRFVKK